MGIKITNNAYGALAAGITASDTVITLTSGNGVRFPVLGAGDYFFGTLIDTANNLEIVRVTARATDTLTVQRGQDGTTARAYSAGDRFELRPTAAMFLAFSQAASIAYNNTVSRLAAINAQTAIDELAAKKQEKLVSGTDIKTVNGLSLVGAGNITITSGEGSGCSGQVFTANGMFTVPAGITKIKVTVVGGGGGGGGSTRYGSGGGDGGGAGGIAVKYITTTPGVQYTVTVGSGGAGGSIGGAGGSGGTSSFGAECSATGGSGGVGARTSETSPAATAGGVGVGGTYNIPGGRGKRAAAYTSYYGQDGGDSLFGCGGLGVLFNIGAGGAAAGYGAGGGGGGGGGYTAYTGGAGAPGIVIVEW